MSVGRSAALASLRLRIGWTALACRFLLLLLFVLFFLRHFALLLFLLEIRCLSQLNSPDGGWVSTLCVRRALKCCRSVMQIRPEAMTMVGQLSGRQVRLGGRWLSGQLRVAWIEARPVRRRVGPDRSGWFDAAGIVERAGTYD